MNDYLMTVEYNRQISAATYEMKLSHSGLPEIHCGQFAEIESSRHDLLLRRPFCIHKKGKDYIVLVYIVVGKGTVALSGVKAGGKLKVILPLGNGFILQPEHKRVVLIGGGVGCAPLLTVPECYPDKTYYSFLGFPTVSSVCFAEDFKKTGDTTVCTDDGSAGYRGYPTDAFLERLHEIKPDVVLTCGSEAMMRAVAKLCKTHGLKGYMSGESRMGCGVGACLVCACKVKDGGGGHKNVRACIEGPVFDLDEVIL